MKFEWDNEKNHTNLNKHGIDFNTAKELWDDPNRIEIHTEHPIENRNILIGKMGKNCGPQFLPCAAIQFG